MPHSRRPACKAGWLLRELFDDLQIKFVLIILTVIAIILFSRRVHGRKKLYWVLISLLSVIILPIITIAFCNGNFSQHDMIGYSYLYAW